MVPELLLVRASDIKHGREKIVVSASSFTEISSVDRKELFTLDLGCISLSTKGVGLWDKGQLTIKTEK